MPVLTNTFSDTVLFSFLHNSEILSPVFSHYMLQLKEASFTFRLILQSGYKTEWFILFYVIENKDS